MKTLLIVLTFLFLSCSSVHNTGPPIQPKSVFNGCKITNTEFTKIIGSVFYDCTKGKLVGIVIFVKDGHLAGIHAHELIQKKYGKKVKVKLLFQSFIIGKNSLTFPFLLFSVDSP